MTHDITAVQQPGNWRRWFAEAGIDYVEVLACPDETCEHCRPEPQAAAAA